MLLFSEYGERVQARITSFYGIAVVTRDIQDPLTGDLNGAEIHLDHLLGAEERLFLLGHLFGHTVQWNVHPDAFDIGRLREPPVAEAEPVALAEQVGIPPTLAVLVAQERLLALQEQA